MIVEEAQLQQHTTRVCVHVCVYVHVCTYMGMYMCSRNRESVY